LTPCIGNSYRIYFGVKGNEAKEERNMNSEEKIKISPIIRAYSDDNHQKLEVEVELPGVEKNNIDLKIHDDSFYLTAPRENVVYVANYATCCPVDPDKATAKYKNGLLKIEVPFLEMREKHIKVEVK
jgi:HSP20 family molecular chaperone IbpA